MRYFLILFFVLATVRLGAQVTEKYHSPLAGFYRAEDLFEKEQYSAARKEFRLFIDEYKGAASDPFRVKALYYEGISALELYNNDAVSLLESFNREYPESIYKYDIFLRIGRYYYQKKDYDKTIEWFAQLDRRHIEPEYQEEYFFKFGYAYFHEERFPEAKSMFYEVKDSTSQYGAPSLYYYSHLSYKDGSYQTALEGFQKLLSDVRFKGVVPYYITQIYYLQGKYQEVTDFAPAYVDSMKPGEQVEMNHLIGDAYYKLGKFDEAVPFLETYNQKANTSRDDDYQLGYAYFKSSAYEKAIVYFDKVSRVKDTLGQIALYHAAECYLNLNELAYARKAFGAAAQLDMDLMIQEDALFNYAVLSYKLDLNPYDEAVVALEDYIRKYPNSPRKNVVFQYLVNCYASTKNYAKALESLDKLPNKDSKLKGAYQMIAFNRGVELYQKAEFRKAIEAFGLIEKYPVSQDISAKGVYWTADSYYQLRDFTKAIQSYRAFIAMPSDLSGMRADAYYNIGYAYIELKDQPQTIEAFKLYLQQSNLTNTRKKADAMMRLADAYYISKQNAPAIDYYNQAYNLKVGYEDQALFYMARVYGFQQQREEKIKRLQDIINNYPNSKYLLNSVYEVGLSYYNAGNSDMAIRYFEQVVRDYPSSILVKDALHYIGDAYFKKKEYTKAESYYQRVLTEYGNDRATCVRETNGLADVYTAQKQLGKLENLPNLYPCADSIRFEVEDKYYDQAMEAYDDSLYAQSIGDFDGYLAKYPNGKYRQEILNYKADALYKLKREQEAIDIYKVTLEAPNDDFTERAAQRTARFLYNAGEYEMALPYYTRLEQVAKTPAMIQTAELGLMRCHFILENFANAAEYAKKVLANKQIDNSVKLEAEFAKGISLARTERFPESVPSLEYVVKNTTTEFGAEAKYNLAEGYFKQGDLAKSETEIRALLKMKPGYDFWIAKALILQTRVLVAKKDLFQAEQTIKSVIDNYPEEDDGILSEAGELYDEIMQMKNQPKNIEEKSGTVIEVEETPGK
jgi:tetratricopeptide (TPR) repeat protein